MLSSPGRLGLTRHLVLLDRDQVIAHAAACESAELGIHSSKESPTERLFNVTSVLVHPSKRGQKLGSLLMQALEARILQEIGNNRPVKMCLDAKNQAVVNFYEKLGYRTLSSSGDASQPNVSLKDATGSPLETQQISSQTRPPAPPPLPVIAANTQQKFPRRVASSIPMFKNLNHL